MSLAKRALRAALLAALTLLSAYLYRQLPRTALSAGVPQSTAVYSSDQTLLRLSLSGDERYRLWLPLAEFAPELIEAVLLKEDRWFYYHLGVNPSRLLQAAFASYLGGNRQGGSTISMQLARLKYALHTRSAFGKLKQVAIAIRLERQYSKVQILEAYLNLAPYGRNIEGAGAASLIYFNKPARQLNLPEALTLAVLPQRPSMRQAGAGAKQISGDLKRARDHLYQKWLTRFPDAAQQRGLFNVPLALRSPEKLPFLAPHAVERELLAERALGRSVANLVTTIKMPMQRLLELQVHAHVRRRGALGLRNASALLLDTRDMSVQALVGSADYFDSKIAGQVNGTAAKRSPGSTLKPFIYALALDQGRLHAQTVLRDVPTSFGPFTPENFDGRFIGPVTATQALVRSRNIPAVTVAAQLSKPNLYQFLAHAGVARMASESHYGLALVLGGGEVSMTELARLYASLANSGRVRALRFQTGDPSELGSQVLSPEAAFITRKMLEENPRPRHASRARSGIPIAWKTGTSWGFRDAWTAGLFGPYVLVVWVGNFDGSSNPALIGVEAAAPLFFAIADAISAQQNLRGTARPAGLNVKRVEICRASGDLPNAWCPARGLSWFIPGKSPIRVSEVHRALWVDRQTGLPLCAGAAPTASARMEIAEFWPSDLAEVFAQAGLPRHAPPKNPRCNAEPSLAANAPQITSPLRGVSYTLSARALQSQAITLRATTDAGVRAVFWFENNRFLARSEPGRDSTWLPGVGGNFVLRAIDDRGQVATRLVNVVLRP